jgi:hypothetical protein
MTRVEALAIAAPLFVAAVAGLFALLTNYLDDRATAKRPRQEQADALSQMTTPALPQSDLSKIEREQLKLHIETLEAFAETVKNAGAVLEESSRHVHRAGS